MKQRINQNTWIQVTGPKYVPVGNHEEYGVVVKVLRWLPYPEGTLGAEDGGVDEVIVFHETVLGSERFDRTVRNRIGRLGAVVPVPPSPERVEAARQRALQHLDADSWAWGDPRRHIWNGVGIYEPPSEWADA